MTFWLTLLSAAPCSESIVNLNEMVRTVGLNTWKSCIYFVGQTYVKRKKWPTQKRRTDEHETLSSQSCPAHDRYTLLSPLELLTGYAAGCQQPEGGSGMNSAHPTQIYSWISQYKTQWTGTLFVVITVDSKDKDNWQSVNACPLQIVDSFRVALWNCHISVASDNTGMYLLFGCPFCLLWTHQLQKCSAHCSLIYKSYTNEKQWVISFCLWASSRGSIKTKWCVWVCKVT